MKPCAFCKNQSNFVCDWPTEKPVAVDAHDVRHGDILHHGKGVTGRVVDIEVKGQNYRFRVQIITCGLYPKRLIGTEPWVECYYGFRPYVSRLAACGSPACDLHVREVAEDRHYCQAHWNAWKEVAA